MEDFSIAWELGQEKIGQHKTKCPLQMSKPAEKILSYESVLFHIQATASLIRVF